MLASSSCSSALGGRIILSPVRVGVESRGVIDSWADHFKTGAGSRLVMVGEDERERSFGREAAVAAADNQLMMSKF